MHSIGSGSNSVPSASSRPELDSPEQQPPPPPPSTTTTTTTTTAAAAAETIRRQMGKPAPLNLAARRSRSGSAARFLDGSLVSFLLPPTPGPDHVAAVMTFAGKVSNLSPTHERPDSREATDTDASNTDTDTTMTDRTDTNATADTAITTTTTTTTATTNSGTANASKSKRIANPAEARVVHHHKSQPNLRRSRDLPEKLPDKLVRMGIGYEVPQEPADKPGKSNSSHSSHSSEGTRGLKHRYQNSWRRLDHYLWSENRPDSTRSHLRHWHRSSSTVIQDASQYLRASIDGSSPTTDSPPSMTTAEFENLPPTVQRKYFSTLERLRFAQHLDLAGTEIPATTANTPIASCDDFEPFSPPLIARNDRQETSQDGIGQDCRVQDRPRRPQLKARFASETLAASPTRRRIANPTLDRIYSTSIDGLNARNNVDASALAVKRQRQSVILDATDEAFMKKGKRRSHQKLQSFAKNQTTTTTTTTSSDLENSDMHCLHNSPMMDAGLQATAESMFDSFQWLENNDDLDLRLGFDHFKTSLDEEAPATEKDRPLFRRHLSISKLPFGRPSSSWNSPVTSDAGSPITAASPAPLPSPTGHARRRSRALSLISPVKHPRPDLSQTVDADAAHYQDPEARMKLRVYLASAHKFDEALEFGFPSIDEVQGKEGLESRVVEDHKGSTKGPSRVRILSDDDKSSMYTDEASATEPDTPKTPQDTEMFDTMDTPVAPERKIKTSHDALPPLPKVDYAQAPASSRDMTLRMTLTRPDLRAHEDHIYGWQRKISVGHKPMSSDEPASPTGLSRNSDRKESIERQFALIDQENMLANGDGGAVKRFWNRVRRS